MAVLGNDEAGAACIYVKGAPEVVLAMSANERTEEGGDRPA